MAFGSGRPSNATSAAFRPDIQGLRAIAVLLVIADHAGTGLSGGFIGVDIFFVISGYVIAGMLLRELRDHGRLQLRRFYLRRAYRLIPALAVVIIATAVLTSVWLSPLGTQQQSALTGAAAAVGLSNFALYGIGADYFNEHLQSNPYLHTWSLGVEEQFYLIFPVVLLVAWWLSKSRPLILPVTIGLLIISSFALSYWTSTTPVIENIAHPPTFAFYMMPTRMWEFGLGALVALGAPWLSRHGWHAAASIVGVSTIAAGAVVIDGGMPFPGTAALLPTAGTALMLYGGLGHGPVTDIMGTRALVHLGDISYSLYLWHWPLIVIADRLWHGHAAATTVAVGLSYGAAVLTYRYIETPFRKRSITWRWRHLRAPAVAVVATVIATMAVLQGAVHSWGSDSVASTVDQVQALPARYDQCLSATPISQRELQECTWPGAGERPIYLVGDSNAQQYTDALVAVASSLDRPLTVATWGDCPIFSLARVEFAQDLQNRECAEYASDAAEWFADQAPGTVVMASAGARIDLPEAVFYDDGGSLIDTAAGRERLWADAMSAGIDDLQAAGHEVLVVRTMPYFAGESRRWWHPIECQNTDLFLDPRLCATRVSAVDMTERMSSIVAAESAAIRASGASSLDLTGVLCSNNWCETYADGMWRYRDGVHLSAAFARTLESHFLQAMP